MSKTLYEELYIKYCQKYLKGDLNTGEMCDLLINSGHIVNKEFFFEEIPEYKGKYPDVFYHTDETNFIHKKSGLNVGNVYGMTGYLLLLDNPDLEDELKEYEPPEPTDDVDIFAEENMGWLK